MQKRKYNTVSEWNRYEIFSVENWMRFYTMSPVRTFYFPLLVQQEEATNTAAWSSHCFWYHWAQPFISSSSIIVRCLKKCIYLVQSLYYKSSLYQFFLIYRSSCMVNQFFTVPTTPFSSHTNILYTSLDIVIA